MGSTDEREPSQFGLRDLRAQILDVKSACRICGDCQKYIWSGHDHVSLPEQFKCSGGYVAPQLNEHGKPITKSSWADGSARTTVIGLNADREGGSGRADTDCSQIRIHGKVLPGVLDLIDEAPIDWVAVLGIVQDYPCDGWDDFDTDGTSS